MAKLNSMKFSIKVTDIKPLPKGWDSGLNQTGIVAKSSKTTTSTTELKKLEAPNNPSITIAVSYSQ